MNVIEIPLSSGKNFKVRQLGLFELDNLMPDSIGPFTYKMTILGKEHDVEFDIGTYETPPEKPEKNVSDIVEFTPEHDQLLDWQLYNAAKYHNEQRLVRTNEFYDKVKAYIVEQACVDNPNLIITIEDWRKVYDAALVPQLTLELIAKTLTNTYAAKFNGRDVFSALEHAKKGRGSYDTIKYWENTLMIKMQKTELEYTMIPLEERARKVCAMFLNEIMGFLEMDFEAKIRESKG